MQYQNGKVEQMEQTQTGKFVKSIRYDLGPLSDPIS